MNKMNINPGLEFIKDLADEKLKQCKLDELIVLLRLSALQVRYHNRTINLKPVLQKALMNLTSNSVLFTPSKTILLKKLKYIEQISPGLEKLNGELEELTRKIKNEVFSRYPYKDRLNILSDTNLRIIPKRLQPDVMIKTFDDEEPSNNKQNSSMLKN